MAKRASPWAAHGARHRAIDVGVGAVTADPFRVENTDTEDEIRHRAVRLDLQPNLHRSARRKNVRRLARGIDELDGHNLNFAGTPTPFDSLGQIQRLYLDRTALRVRRGLRGLFRPDRPLFGLRDVQPVRVDHAPRIALGPIDAVVEPQHLVAEPRHEIK